MTRGLVPSPVYGRAATVPAVGWLGAGGELGCHIETHRVIAIVSGGQTGADRGALDAAIALGLDHGGYCPKGRRAEDGVIPARYRLQELDVRAYAARTEKNVLTSDATLLVTRGRPTTGSALTRRLARRHGRPLLHIDLESTEPRAAVDRVRAWLREARVARLNVAGPRESACPGIARDVRRLLVRALTEQ